MALRPIDAYGYMPALFAHRGEPGGQLSIRSGPRVHIITIHYQPTGPRSGHVYGTYRVRMQNLPFDLVYRTPPLTEAGRDAPWQPAVEAVLAAFRRGLVN